MYGMPQRRGRSRVHTESLSRGRSSSSSGHSGKHGVAPAAAPPARKSDLGFSSRDSISALPIVRRSSPSGGGTTDGRSSSGSGGSSPRRRRRNRGSSPRSQVRGPRQARRGDDSASSSLMGEASSPPACAGREEADAVATAGDGAAEAAAVEADQVLRGGASPPAYAGLDEVAAAAAAAAAAVTAAAAAAAAGAGAEVVGGVAAEVADLEEDRATPSMGTMNSLGDHEREALLTSLSEAYTQVNDLTYELKISLDKLDKLDKLDRSGTAPDPEKDARTLFTPGPPLGRRPPPTPGAPACLPGLLLRTSAEAGLLCSSPPTPAAVPAGLCRLGGNILPEVNQSPEDAATTEHSAALRKRNTLHKIFNDVIPRDEEEDVAAPPTPAVVRQLRVEIEGLRERDAQALAKEEKYQSDISNMQRHVALLESKIISQRSDLDGAAAPSTSSSHTNTNTTTDNISSSSSSSSSTRSRSGSRSSNGSRPASAKLPSHGAYCTTPGGTRYRETEETKSLIARVTALEEELACSRAENAKAKQALRGVKQGQNTAKLKGKKLEKSVHKLKNELAKSRAMSDCLQKEVDRLQSLDPEDSAQGSGWQRQWLNGLKKPVSPEPTPIKIDGDPQGGEAARAAWRWIEASAPESNPIQPSDGNSNASSPVVLVGDLDLDKNRLVYTTDRSQFVYLDYLKTNK